MALTKVNDIVITTPVQSAQTSDHITNQNYNGYGNKTISTSAPPAGVGSEGDIWYQY